MAKKDAVAVREETTTALEPHREPVEQLGNLDLGDVTLPRYRLVQPTSAASKEAGGIEGEFFDALSIESHKQVLIVPLSIRKGMVRFEEGDDKPDCGSRDGLVPDASRFESPISDHCGELVAGRIRYTCHEAQRGGRCSQIYDLLALAIETDADGEHVGCVPFVMTLKGWSRKAVKDLHTWCQIRHVAYHDVACTMSAKKVKNDKGTFFVAQFSGYTKLEQGRYEEFARTFASYDVTRTDAAESEAKSDEPAADGSF